MPALDDALATIGANLPEDVRQAHIRDRVVALANSAQATILIEDVLPADPVQVGILVIEDLGAACVASDPPTPAGIPADPVRAGRRGPT